MVKKRALERKFDANSYAKERIVAINYLKKSKFELQPLYKISNFNKSIVKDVFDLPYIGLENIESNTGLYIETTAKESYGSAAFFKKGQILFSKLRPYLNKVYCAEFDGVCSTEFHIIDSKKVSNQYLSIFLRSNLVVSQTKYLMSGNTLPRLQTEDIEKLLIPILPLEIEQQVVLLMENTFLDLSNIEKSTKLFLSEIDDYLLNSLEIEKANETAIQRFFYINACKITSNRFDPKSYLNFYDALRVSIEKGKYETVTLRSLIIQSGGGDWGKDESDNIQTADYEKCIVLRATEFDNDYNLNLDGSRVKYRMILKDKLKKLSVQVGDLLIEKSGGSENQPVGRIGIIEQSMLDNDTVAFSNFIHKIRVDSTKVDANYLFCYLKTMHNIKLTDAMQSQTNGIRNLIMKEYLSQKIPLPNLEIQKEIASKIYAMRNEAKNLQENAKALLESTKKEIELMIIG